MYETDENDDFFYTPEERKLHRQQIAVQKKLEKAKAIIKASAGDDKQLSSKLSKAAQDKIIKKLLQIHFPFETKQIKLLLGLALYGMELLEKADQDPEAKKEIVSRMKQCDEYFKELHRKKAEQKSQENVEENSSEQIKTIESNSSQEETIPSQSKPTTTYVDDAITWQ